MKFSRILILTSTIMLCSPLVMADKVGIVNVLDVFNTASFVMKANKDLEAHAKKMDATLQQKKARLQNMIKTFEKTTSRKTKKKLAKEIADAQKNLSKLTQSYQKKVQEEQNAGMKKFTKMLQEATQKIAQEKQLNTVLNSNSILYTDNTWINITNDVKAAFPKD